MSSEATGLVGVFRAIALLAGGGLVLSSLVFAAGPPAAFAEDGPVAETPAPDEGSEAEESADEGPRAAEPETVEPAEAPEERDPSDEDPGAEDSGADVPASAAPEAEAPVDGAQIADVPLSGAAAGSCTTVFPDTYGTKFKDAITWMRGAGLTDGVQSGGTRYYQPSAQLSREAMAAFMFRQSAPKNYRAPGSSPFADVPKSHKFYKQIAWMHSAGLSTGVKQRSGKPKFLPKAKLSREAMAAFMFRQYAPKSYRAPQKSPFADVQPSHKFYRQIAWMHGSGLSTGVKQQGKRYYQPAAKLSREAMAAFLHRQAGSPKPRACAQRSASEIDGKWCFSSEKRNGGSGGRCFTVDYPKTTWIDGKRKATRLTSSSGTPAQGDGCFAALMDPLSETGGSQAGMIRLHFCPAGVSGYPYLSGDAKPKDRIYVTGSAGGPPQYWSVAYRR